MTRSGIELVRSERRRRWTRAEKERLVVASFEPGVSASQIAREAGLHVSQLFRWRKLLCERVVPPAPVPALVPVAIVATPPRCLPKPNRGRPGPVGPTGSSRSNSAAAGVSWSAGTSMRRRCGGYLMLWRADDPAAGQRAGVAGQHVRERFSCSDCETIAQNPAPFHPILRRRAGPNLLAEVMMAKFGLHLPLHRQSRRFAHEGLPIDVSTLAGWVGAVTTTLCPWSPTR